MKKYCVPSVWLLIGILLTSCSKNNDLPQVDNITKGSKWTLKIGSTSADVYAQLQSLGAEKDFNRVALVYRKSYAKPEDIKEIFAYYDALTLQNSSGRIDRVVIRFDHHQAGAIMAGGSLPDSVPKWPSNYPDETAIQKGDPISLVYEKLVKLCQISAYRDYRIILPDKPLNLPYDPDMANYREWAFDFTENRGNGLYGRHSVRLYFDRNRLTKIRDGYNEGQTYN